MTINEVVNKINNGTDLKEILEIRTYIPIAEKRVILETVLDRCFTFEDGVLICDYVAKKVIFELAMIKYHTDIDVDITSEEDYDAMQDIIYSLRHEYFNDYQDCYLLFEGMEKELRAQYSIESSVVSLTKKLSNSIEDIANILTDKISGFDMSSFGFHGVELDQLKTLLNKYGK